MPDGLEEPSPPLASREEDLPGYCSRPGRSRRLLQLPARVLVVALFFLLVITPTEGCLPSWFKKERSTAPAALEGSSIVRTSSLNELFTTGLIKGTKYESPDPVDEQVEYVEESEEDEESELAGPYGTASPIAYDPLIEEYRRAYIERECQDWCFAGGNCTVEVHPKTYAYVTKECICPPGYTGKRCEEHYVKTLYSSVQGDVESPPTTSSDSYELSISLASGGRASRFQMQLVISAVPALAFFFIIVIIAVGLATYSYRKLTRRKVVGDSTWRSSSSSTRTAGASTTESINSPDYYLRRTGGVYNTRSPFSPRTPPPPGYEVNGNVLSPLLKFNGQTTLPQTTLGAHSSTFPPLPNKKKQEPK